MNIKGLFAKSRTLFPLLLQTFALLLLSAGVFAQETTGGLQGTVTDPSGAVVSHAQVVITGASLVGSKAAATDGSGYYHFANLPPGDYTLTVTAKGFKSVKRGGLTIEVGHLPTLNLTLEVGASETVVEVSGAAPVIDVTTTRTMTNVTEDVINEVPHGRSFQSVIQFAPSARNEPLAGNTVQSNGSGGSSPGSTTNGQAFGYSVGGGADSENSYLVEGQETANLIGGYSHTNVPFDFIQEVQVKSSGIEAEHGGALGGVVNVVMDKGSNAWHGGVWTQFENDSMDGHPNAYARYDPLDSGSAFASGRPIDPAYQGYQPIKPHSSDVFPGFRLGGPILKDKIFFFAGFNPEWSNTERTVNFGPGVGPLKFSRNTQTYYTNARIDAAVSQKIRVFGSWLYQYQRQSGENMPGSDSTTPFNFNFANPAGFYNVSTSIPPFAYSHSLGYSAPNSTTNVGADITITPRMVATTRFGYYFENYHDFGFPTNGNINFFEANGINQTDVNGNPLPAAFQQANGYFNVANSQNYTVRNANKHIQFDQDLAWFKSGWFGTHNFKFGYQLHRITNDIFQRYNEPAVQIFPGSQSFYYAGGSTGFANCAALVASQGGNPAYGDPAGSNCTGTYGYAVVQDYGSFGTAKSYNHGFFFQDAWTLGRGVTINAGLRIEKEYLPSETVNAPAGFPKQPIEFGWGDKIAPRIGAAWDVFKDGRMKVFGSYGVFNDMMKLNLAISSFGGQYWQNCAYAMMSPNSVSLLNIAFNSAGRYCTGDSTGGANFANGSTPAGLVFLENANERGTEGVTPGLKPYRQHESVFGVDYQIKKNLAFEARWDRRRLDHVIEDAALFDSTGNEVFTIVNPGQGQNRLNTTCATAGVSPYTGDSYPACPVNPSAARSYDGVEFRLVKSTSQHWFGMLSYTYSHLRGNYTGLTSTDISDGGGGRNAPNNSRAFDETYFQFNADGNSSSGLLPTDRPSTFKGYAYYELGWKNKWTTDLGIFQFAYQGSPVSSYVDVGYSVIPGNYFAVYTEDRGKWANVVQDPTTGNLSVTGVSTRRTPWFTQTDFSLTQNYKLSESRVISFQAIIPNLWNQRAVTAYGEQVDSGQFATFETPGGLPFYYGGEAYSLYEHPYNWKSLLNTNQITLNSQYNQPYLYQLARTIRLGIKFTF
ncbi:MAG: carboxypeptidase regulatory-like domain-containing protein [Terriglobales bacterium]